MPKFFLSHARRKAFGFFTSLPKPFLIASKYVNPQNQFIVDDVSKIIKEAIETTIGGNAYQHDKGEI